MIVLLCLIFAPRQDVVKGVQEKHLCVDGIGAMLI